MTDMHLEVREFDLKKKAFTPAEEEGFYVPEVT